jgi:2-polyprenyl-3-methyl-5-hydroxy-6-metoxy-1,4-benzoquinol methylase
MINDNTHTDSSKLVDMPKLENPLRFCRACGQKVDVSSNEIINGFLEETSFVCITCTQCGTMQTGFGDTDNLTNIYNSIYNYSEVISGYKRYNLYGWLSSRSIFRSLFDIIYAERLYYGAYLFVNKKYKQERHKLKILEIGSGLGYTTARFRKLGHEVIGCDLSNDACTRATKLHGGEFICGTIDYVKQKHGKSFDIIVCLEVIEHVDDPFQLLTDFKSVLKDDGNAIISTPNLMAHSKWNTTEPPIHVTYFTLSGIKQLMCRLNCDAELVTFQNRLRNKVTANPQIKLPGSVLLKDFSPNQNYFDNGPLSFAEKMKILTKNQINKIYYRCIDKSVVSNLKNHPENLISTSIIINLRFPKH